MKKVLGGVAVAAVMGACALAGGVERAEAAKIDFGSSIQYSNDNGFTFSGTYDTEDRSNTELFFSFISPNIDPSHFFDNHAYTIVRQISSDAMGVTFDVDISNRSFAYTYVFADDIFPDTSTNISVVGYDIHFSAYHYTGADKTYIGDIYSTPFIGPVEGPNEPLLAGSLVTTVPLPASLPLFGAALLALGGVAYARRRGHGITPLALPQG